MKPELPKGQGYGKACRKCGNEIRYKDGKGNCVKCRKRKNNKRTKEDRSKSYENTRPMYKGNTFAFTSAKRSKLPEDYYPDFFGGFESYKDSQQVVSTVKDLNGNSGKSTWTIHHKVPIGIVQRCAENGKWFMGSNKADNLMPISINLNQRLGAVDCSNWSVDALDRCAVIWLSKDNVKEAKEIGKEAFETRFSRKLGFSSKVRFDFVMPPKNVLDKCSYWKAGMRLTPEDVIELEKHVEQALKDLALYLNAPYGSYEEEEEETKPLKAPEGMKFVVKKVPAMTAKEGIHFAIEKLFDYRDDKITFINSIKDKNLTDLELMDLFFRWQMEA